MMKKQITENSPKLLFLAVAYVVIIMLCNMNNNAKPIMFTSWLGIYLADLTIPLIWLLKDTIQRLYGKKTIRQLIAINVTVNVFIYLWATIGNATAPDALYGYISGSVVMFIFSMIGFYISENIDATVYDKVPGSHVRKALLSNVASVPVDSLFACVGLKLIGVEWQFVMISLCVQLILKLGIPALVYVAAKIKSRV